MVNFGFGDYVYAGKDRKGEDRYLPAYCAHVLSPFRITKGNAVILSTNDYNYSYDGEWTQPDIGEKNNCLYDSRVKKLIKEYSDEVIEKVTLTEYGDLIIDTANLSFSAFQYLHWQCFLFYKALMLMFPYCCCTDVPDNSKLCLQSEYRLL